MKKNRIPFLLVLLMACSSVVAQYKKTVEVTQEEHAALKKEGKIERGTHYILKKENNISAAKQIHVPINNPVLTTPCGQLPALNYAVVPSLVEIDDGSSPAIALPFTFCFYGTNYNSVYVNGNGNITFGSGSISFSSTGFPNATDAMIAPFWADLDNRNGNGTVSTAAGPDYFAVTWNSVGYYSMHGDKRVTCTVVITDGLSTILPAGNNVGLFYGNMDWTTGDASGGVNGFGGTAATVGVNKGDGTNFIQIGRFDTSGTQFINNTALNNGVDWLDGKSFFFNLCATGNNIAPVSVNYSDCDTIKICSPIDTLLLENYFASPETDQITTVTVSAPTLGSNITSYLNQSGATAHVISEIITSPALSGYHTLTYTATDNGTPSQTTTVNITIYVANAETPIDPVININPQGICPGEQTTLSITNCSQFTSYNWSTGVSGCSITASAAANDYLTVEDNAGCNQTVFFNIALLDAPQPDVVGNLFYCSGSSSTSLQLAPPTSSEPNYASITWSDGSTGNSINATAGSYTVTVTGDNGCSTDSTFVVVNAGPPAIDAISDTCISLGGSAQLDVNFAGPVSTTCGLGTSTGSGTTQNFSLGTASAAVNSSTTWPTPYGNWYGNARHQFLFRASELAAMGAQQGLIKSISFNVTNTNGIDPLPNFTIKVMCTNLNALPAQTSSDQFVAGAVQVYSTPVYNIVTGTNTHIFNQPYSWDGVSNLIIETCFDMNPFTSNASVSQSNTSFISTINSYSDSYGVCTSPIGSNVFAFNNYTKRPDVVFNMETGVDPTNYTYSWSPAGSLSDPLIKNPIASPSTSTLYTVTVTTIGTSCTITDTVRVRVGPPVDIIASDSVFCDNFPVTNFSPSTTGGTWAHITGSGANAGGIVTNGTGVDFHPELSTLGASYVVYLVQSAGCILTDTLEVNVSHHYTPSFTPIGPFCDYSSPVMLDSLATSPGGVWTIDGTPATMFDPVALGASPNPGYSLQYYQANNNVCPDSVSIPVMVNPTPVVNVIPMPDSLFCDNQGPYQIGLSATTGTTGTWVHHYNGTNIGGGLSTTTGASVNFNSNLSVVGTSYVVYTYNDGNCVNSDSLQVQVNQHVPATYSSIGPFCEYDANTNLNAIVDNSPGTWTIDGNANSIFSPSMLGPSTSPGYLIKYVTNSNGCKDSSSSYVTVYPKPTVDFSADTLSGCLPSVPIAFTSTVTGTPATSGAYMWSFGDGGATGLSDPVHVYTKPGSQSVSLTYTDINGCIASEIKSNYILINTVPSPDFAFDPQVPTYLEPHVDFTNTTNNGGGYIWSWDIAGFDTADTYNTSFDFPTYGDFYVTLTATSAVGCIGTITHPVSVKPDYVLYVPNAFTPNGDGKNDVFKPAGDGIQTDGYQMSIFDRWGEKVFETADITEGWKGSNGNSDNIYLEAGIYVYKIIYKDPDLKGHEVVGHVTVIR